MPVLAAMAAAVLVAGVAAGQSWQLGEGAQLVDGPVTLQIASETLLLEELTFETTGAPVLDGVALRFDAPLGGPLTWNLTVWEPDRILFRGSAAQETEMQIDGLDGDWQVIAGANVFLIPGSGGAAWTVPEGTVAVELRRYAGGSLALSTSLDPWIPILLWGGLAVLFLYFVAWLPAMSAIFAAGGALLDPPLLSTTASALLIIISLFLHVLATRGIIPRSFGKGD